MDYLKDEDRQVIKIQAYGKEMDDRYIDINVYM